MRAEILYEDRHIITAYKPAGLATQTAKVGQADMVSELKNHTKSSYLGVVHRLDQPVEGVLVFGKTKAATAALNRQLAQGTLNKKYYAVLCGRQGAEITEADGTLTNYLRKTPDGRAEIVTAGNAEGKPAAGDDAKKAVLRYKILRVCAPEAAGSEQATGKTDCDSDVRICLADIRIETGRFHQIRAQMAHAGMPLLGDSKYGDERSRQISAALGAQNVALCAYELRFTHPVTGRRMDFRIEPREEIFQRFFEKLPK